MAEANDNRRLPQDAKRVLRPVVAVLACCLIAFCGWSAWQYSHGADPLAFLAGDAFKTVASEEASPAWVELADDSEAGADEEVEPAESPVESEDASAVSSSSTEGEAPASSASGGDASSSSSGSSYSSPSAPDSGDTSSYEGTGSASEGNSSESENSAPAQDGSTSVEETTPAPAPDPEPTAITVKITVDGSSVGAGSSSATLSLSPGASVYDALASSGVSYNAKSTGYGMYVSSIAGVAEKEHGGMSGWMYSVNGVTPNVACSVYELSDGDSIYWWYANAE